MAGHHPYVVVGGGTGAIGDPSGKNSERKLQTMDQVKHNQDGLSAQMYKLFGHDENFSIVNNYDWLSKISLLDFLRDYGKLFSVNTMLNKEVVASRLEVAFHTLNSHTKSYNQLTSYTCTVLNTCNSRLVGLISGAISPRGPI